VTPPRPYLSLALTVALCLGASPPAAAQAPVRVEADYRLGAADRVEVTVAEAPQLGLAEGTIAADGTLTLPVVGAVPAAGRTAEELAAEIEQRLEADYLARATVAVEVLDVQARTVSVLGAVAKPGSYGFAGDWTVLEAIGAAGGLAAEHGNSVRIVRHAENGLSDQITLPLADLVERADPRLDLPLAPNDVIHVERLQKVTILLVGEVATRGAIELDGRTPVTLLGVIARAGGLTERASPRLIVKRRGADGLLVDIEAHYKRILSGRDPDVDLVDGDMIVVQESFF
jgi:protein involved in polysaccharide export with SLBB domain